MAASQIKNELRQFAESTSLHGIGNAAKEKRNMCTRLLWILAFLCMTGVYLYLLSQTLLAYYGRQVVTTVDYLSIGSLNFPSVTICNSNVAKYSAVRQDEVANYLYNTPPGGNDEPSFNLDEIDIRSISQTIAHQPPDMYLECAFDGQHQTPCNVSKEVTWVVTPDGFCHTFNSYQFSQMYGTKVSTRSGEIFGLYLLINIEEYEYFKTLSNTTGIQAQIHDQNELANIREDGFVVAPGTETFVVVKKTVVKRLPEPYAKSPNLCEDTLSYGYENTLKYFPSYSLSACRRECRIAHQISLCNCSSYQYGGNGVPLCSYTDFVGCSIEADNIFNSDASLAAACECKHTCEEIIYDMTVSSTSMPNRLNKDSLVNAINVSQINSSNIDENIITLKIFFGEMRYTLVKQQSQYTATSLFGELGGNLGLCLGASMLTIAELLQLLGALCAGILRLSSQKVKRVEVQESESTPQM